MKLFNIQSVAAFCVIAVAVFLPSRTTWGQSGTGGEVIGGFNNRTAGNYSTVVGGGDNAVCAHIEWDPQLYGGDGECAM